MYADDLALLARSPGELQLMMNIITQYAKKWRFEINPTKTKILCFAESPEQESERIAEFGSKWRCGGHIRNLQIRKISPLLKTKWTGKSTW